MANSRTAEIRAWLRTSGEQVNERGAIPKRLREKFYAEFPGKRPRGEVAPMPGPDATDDEIDEWEDFGTIEPDGPVEPPRSHAPGISAVPDATGNPPPDGSADPGPAHGRKDWRKPPGKARAGKVTPGIRADIEAKISLALMVPGTIWAARDYCGGIFVQQVPATAAAFTNIVCNSADLVAWFTGSGGQFMLWLDVAMALYPVGTAMMAHHVYHTIGEQAEDAQQPNYSDYAA